MMFGAISGSAIAASTSIGGVMVPMSAREGYDRGFAAAVNIASAPTGMLIPPTTAFILYALASGEHRLPPVRRRSGRGSAVGRWLYAGHAGGR